MSWRERESRRRLSVCSSPVRQITGPTEAYDFYLSLTGQRQLHIWAQHIMRAVGENGGLLREMVMDAKKKRTNKFGSKVTPFLLFPATLSPMAACLRFTRRVGDLPFF